MKFFYLVFIIILLSQNTDAQSNDSIFLLKPYQLYITEGVIYGGTMIGLNVLWYKDYPHSSFHWFNDSKEWLQMDKVGHGFSSYYLTNISVNFFKQTRLNHDNKDLLFGSMTAWVYISSVEIFDGFSQKWGASYSDLIANTIGVGIFTLQELAWHEQVFVPKFSFHQTKYSNFRPDALGENIVQNIFKDYNGQTYWLSATFNNVFNIRCFPEWLCFSVGYSADGLLGGMENPSDLPTFIRHRQYVLSLDIDFKKIKVNSKILSRCFKLINVLKFPFPSFVLDGNKIKTSVFYF